MDKLYYTPREVAAILAISDDAVLDLVNRGTMPALRVSPRITRIPIAAFDQWRQGFVPRRRRVSIAPARRQVVVGEGEAVPEPRRLAER
ncbi:MAG: helix-turn-helix domain-containing protein [Candidatus Limnocylindrales bacterium]